MVQSRSVWKESAREKSNGFTCCVCYLLLVVLVAVIVFESGLMFMRVGVHTILVLVLGVLVIVGVVGVRMLRIFMLMLMGLIVTMFGHLVPSSNLSANDPTLTSLHALTSNPFQLAVSAALFKLSL